jgi:molybdopterin-guanine dinucleotide biosynthesis protein
MQPETQLHATLSRLAPDLVKASFVTRRFPFSEVRDLNTSARPRAGDLAIARVEQISQHTRLQLVSGRRSQLYVGDRILVCYGNRYAPDQFEAEVPRDLGPCHLVTAGGVAGRMLSRHARLRTPTSIRPEGLLVDNQGNVLNLRRFGLQVAQIAGTDRVPVIGVLGTSMNAGKTTAAAALVHGLSSAGMRVAAIKATGTGSGNDVWSLEDAGASLVLDFSDAGYPSTYKVPPVEIEHLFDRLVTHARQQEVEVVVVEVADGLLHEETATLVAGDVFRETVDTVIFCAGDALGARGGVEWLELAGVPVAGVSGAVTASPLAMREVRGAVRLPVFTRECLASPAVADKLLPVAS